MLELLREHWASVAAAVGALIASGLTVRFLWARSGRDVTIVNQRGASAQGDIVGRDKITRENKHR